MSVNKLPPEACEHCRFWLYTKRDGDDGGRCRRYPPVPDADYWSTHPYAHFSGWCGEFQWKTPWEGER